MFQRTRDLFTLILGDVACFLFSLGLTLTVRYHSVPSEDLWSTHLGPFLALSGLWIVIFYAAGLYDNHTHVFKRGLISKVVRTNLINIVCAAALFALLPFGIAPKTNLLIYLGISTALLTFWRINLYPALLPKRRMPALLIWGGTDADELAHEVAHNAQYPHFFVARISPEDLAAHSDPTAFLREHITRDDIRLIAADPRDPAVARVVPILFEHAFIDRSVQFVDVYSLYTELFDCVPLSCVRPDWFLEHVAQSNSVLYDTVKRVLDICGGLSLLLGLLCVLPFVALALRLEGRGPLFIAQIRVGRFGRPITVYKIRTMRENRKASDTWVREEGAQDTNTITRVGDILRKTSIDEWPQCISILRGDMSLIGPRADIVGLAERARAELPYYAMRTFAQPGITGWAQTRQRYHRGNISPQSMDETRVRLAYDLYYVKHRSIFLDIAITLRTIGTLLARAGHILYGNTY